MLKLKLQYFGHLIWRVDSLEKTDAGRDWGQEKKGATENEMAGWHHQLDGRWVWVNSGSWWWTGRPGVLRFMGSQRVGHDWATELNWKLPTTQIRITWCILLKTKQNKNKQTKNQIPRANMGPAESESLEWGLHFKQYFIWFLHILTLKNHWYSIWEGSLGSQTLPLSFIWPVVITWALVSSVKSGTAGISTS